jgi:glycerol uptake facilitator protein
MNEYLGEFLGTLLLILLGDGVVAGVLLKGSKAEGSGWLTIVLGWGVAVSLAIYAVGSVSGAHLNPAVSLAMVMTGDLDASRLPGYLFGQFAGAFAGAVLVWVHYLPHWAETTDPSTKLAVFCNAPARRSTLANLVSEVIGTFVLVFGLLFIGANEFAVGLNPLVVGALIIAVGLCLGGTTGFAINPARDLAPRVAHAVLPIPGKGNSDWSYAWIPVVGPLVGAVVAVFVYQSLY